MIFKKNIFLFYILTILNGVVPLATISFLSRILSGEQLGTYLLSFTIMNVLGMVVDFGFSISGVRTLKSENIEITSSGYISISFIIKLFIFLLVSILYYIFYIIGSNGNLDFFIITLFGIFFTGLDNVWILQVNEKLASIITKNIVANIVYVSIALSMAYYTRNYLYVLWVFVIYKTYTFSISFNVTRKMYILSILELNKKNVITVIRSTAGIAIFRFFALSYTAANGILLNYLTNKYQVALYLAFEKLTKLILFIATPITQALLPLFSGRPSGSGLLRYISVIIAICSIGLLVGNIYSHEIVAMFLGEKYLDDDTKELFFFMTIVSPFILISNAIGMLYFIPNKLDKLLNYTISSIAFINVILVFYFVHSDANGAVQMARIVAFSEFLVMSVMAVILCAHRRNNGR